LKKLCPTLAESLEGIFLEVIPDIGLNEKVFAQKVATNFRASLGKFGQKSFTPPKINLPLHLDSNI